jgi:pimeloyl-ACP methyl ester carboxylesterase
MGRKLENALGILNGTIGDYLARTGNGLATPMTFVHDGAPMAVRRDVLARAYPDATSRVVVLLHGIMCTETVWTLPEGGDYGAFLARDFGLTPLYIRYNSGLAIADNGVAFADLLESLINEWPVPVEEILLLGFSMGGLVARSACHVASGERYHWLPRVRRAIYVGTPHLGAPLERAGRTLTKVLRAVGDPYARLVAEIGDLRSLGMKDLGDANLRHEDRAPGRADLALRDARHPVPLLPSIQHYLVAGSLAVHPQLAALFGDALVPLASGTNGLRASSGTLALPPGHVKVLADMGHMTLAHHPHVYAQIREWCEASR